MDVYLVPRFSTLFGGLRELIVLRLKIVVVKEDRNYLSRRI